MHEAASRRLQEILNLAARWVAQLDALLPATREEAQRMWGAPTPDAVEDKVVAEAATLLHVASRTIGDDPAGYPLAEAQTPTEDAWTCLRTALAARARPDRHWRLLKHAPHVVWPVGIAHAVLQHSGAEDRRFDALLRECIALTWGERVDRPVFRSLELRWAASVLDKTRPCTQDLIALAPLQASVPTLVTRREDAYALTHSLFYATDFGAYPLPPGISAARVAASVDAQIAYQLWEDDLDLLGELLAAVFCCGLPCDYATTALTAVWEDFARPVVRGPSFSFGSDEPDPCDPEVFGCCYHTTLVTGIMCAAFLTASTAGPTNDERTGADHETITRAALECLKVVGQPSRLSACWVRGIDQVEDATHTVVSCILDGAMAVSYHAGKMAALTELLDRARHYEAHTATSAATAQALAFHARIEQLVA